jgi:hypothetical protein
MAITRPSDQPPFSWRVSFLTTADAIAALTFGVGAASPLLLSDPFHIRLSHRDARAPRPHRTRLPPPARHP